MYVNQMGAGMTDHVPVNPEEYPIFSIEFDAETLLLHWGNTLIRTFGDTQYDHIEHTNDDDQLQGIMATREFFDMLFENLFPYRFDPVVDYHTREWFTKMALRDVEVDELYVPDDWLGAQYGPRRL